MRWRFLTLLATASALIFLLSTGLWVRGLFAADVWSAHLHTPSAGSLESNMIQCSNGWILKIRMKVLFSPQNTPQYHRPMDGTWGHDSIPPGNAPMPGVATGLIFTSYSSSPASQTSTTRSIVFPVYTFAGVRLLGVVGFSAILPGVWIVLRIRRGRVKKAGCCVVCGYDLRASPERCPECGTVRTSA